MQLPFIILLQAWLTGVDLKKATSLKVTPLVEKWEMQHWVSAFAADATLIRCTALISKRDNCLQKGHIIAAVWNGVAHFKTVSHFVSLSPSPPLSLTFRSRALSLPKSPITPHKFPSAKRSTGARTHPRRLPMRRFLKEDHGKVMVEVKPNQRGHP